MKLQILIPQYNETDEIIKPLLDSIAIQQNADLENEVGVIICNDGSDVKLSYDFLNSYPFHIEYYQCEHRGVSATRNACLDYATADYVMFCDADDMFFNACGLWIILNEIKNGGFDTLVSAFVEEGRHPETNESLYITHETDSTFVHGKVHRRHYLAEHNIRWDDRLTIHEDSYFNILCQSCTSNAKHCPTPFYLWKWRDDSVCRRDPKYMLKTYVNMIASTTALTAELLRRGKQIEAQLCVLRMVYDTYYTVNKDEWCDPENAQYLDMTEKDFAAFYQRYREVFDAAPAEMRQQTISGVRTRMFGEGLFLEKFTFDQWIEKINNL